MVTEILMLSLSGMRVAQLAVEAAATLAMCLLRVIMMFRSKLLHHAPSNIIAARQRHHHLQSRCDPCRHAQQCWMNPPGTSMLRSLCHSGFGRTPTANLRTMAMILMRSPANSSSAWIWDAHASTIDVDEPSSTGCNESRSCQQNAQWKCHLTF